MTLDAGRKDATIQEAIEESVFTFKGELHIIEDGSPHDIEKTRRSLHSKWPGHFLCLVHSLPGGKERLIVTHRE